MQNKRDRELDDFWDIENLLPLKSKIQLPRRNPPSHINTVELEFSPSVPSRQPTDVVRDAPLASVTSSDSLSERTDGRQITAPDVTYTPPHPLIREVRLYRWRSNFRFYERFCVTAEQLFYHHGKSCESVPFFSYMPQYDQMNHAQLAWYLYWRDRVRAGEYLETDYSYIFLYLFEIINLPDKIPPLEGQTMLCRIWKRYRDTYPLLNRYLADWICDYSLIHQLPPPGEILTGSLRIIAEQSSFKEFYACPTGDDATQDAQIYLLFCTNYDYRKSKLYLAGGERTMALNRHIPAALSAVLREIGQKSATLANTKMQKSTLSRDTFIGALCSNDMKRRIEVDYCSFNRSHELRFLITDIVKYTENKLRSYFGIKSKLSIYALPDQIKKILDDYFAVTFPSRRPTARIESARPDYEALYDLPKTVLSPEHAFEIEQSSWAVTQQLVEAFDDEENREQDQPLTISTPKLEDAFNSSQENVSAVARLQKYHAFLLAALEKNSNDQRRIARDAGVLPDAVAEQINNIAVDIFGDILLEDRGDGSYIVIEDYTDAVKGLLNS